MANSILHSKLRVPVRGAKFNVTIGFNNAADAAESFDTEISKDNGAFADCTNELEVIGGGTSCDMGYLTLTAAEMTADLVVLKLAAVSGVQPELVDFEVPSFPAIFSGTAVAGSTTQMTLQVNNRPAADGALQGCIVRNNTTGEARHILTYTGSTGIATFGTMETAVANGHTYDILLPDQALLTYWDLVLTRSAVEQTGAIVFTNLPDVLSLANINAQVASALTAAGVNVTTMGRLDVAVSTRLATAGYTAPLDAAGTRTALGLASANLDTQLDNIPTVAEFNARTIVSANYALEATLTAMKGATFNGATDSLEAIRDRGDAAWTTGSGGLDAAGIRAAIGMASANLDTQLAAIVVDTGTDIPATLAIIAGYIDTEVGAIKTKTDLLPSTVDGATLTEWFQAVGAMAAGNLSGAGTGTEVLKGLDGLTTRITATITGAGNRTVVRS